MLRFGLLSRHENLPALMFTCRLAPAAAFLFQHPLLSFGANPHLNGGVRVMRFGLLSRHEILPAPHVPCRLAPAATFLFQHPLLSFEQIGHFWTGFISRIFGPVLGSPPRRVKNDHFPN